MRCRKLYLQNNSRGTGLSLGAGFQCDYMGVTLARCAFPPAASGQQQETGMRLIMPNNKIGPWVCLVIILLLAAVLLSPLPALAAEARGVIVKYKPGQVPLSALPSAGAPGRQLARLGVVPVPKGPSESVDSLLSRFQRDERVEYVEPDYARRALAVYPNDSLFGQQWALARLKLPQAWEATLGSREMVVAVVDSGVDAGHEDLAGRLLPGYDFVNDDAFPEDGVGHGTFVAGIIGALTDNGIGMAGVAWEVTLLPVQVLDSNGYGYDSDIAAGIIFAADQGARVINLSLGGAEYSQTLAEAVAYAEGKGVVVVAAAGNDGGPVIYPAAIPEVVAVGAIQQDGSVWVKSNRGAGLDVVAPGIGVHGLRLGGGTALGSGTSYAAGYVSGITALLRSRETWLAPEQVRQRLQTGTTDVGAAGWDEISGHGEVDAWKVLSYHGEMAGREDVNGDGLVDLYDLVRVARIYGRRPGEPGYESSLDLDGDGEITLGDLRLVAEWYGTR